ncbi:PilZ domain-containing protein, partial [Rahnella variigena]|uniref:PilZ domain-containing protein n=1 Tax=Rahnella variigena TaxID=574964 RepID=UPI0015F2D68F
MTEQASDRRRFRRIAFDAKTELRQNGREWPVQLVDLSLKGLLIQRPDDWKGN